MIQEMHTLKMIIIIINQFIFGFLKFFTESLSQG